MEHRREVEYKSLLDLYIAKPVRDYLEQNFYAKINEQAKLDNLVHNADFMQSMFNHVSLFSDHGVIHVRDIAHLVIDTIEVVNGVLIGPRDGLRLNFMKGYGVIAAYLHDIGMVNFSAKGRATHSDFASQLIFTQEFNSYLDILWDENCGNVPWRLIDLKEKNLLKTDPKIIFREILALVPVHSKSRFPIEIVNDRKKLRKEIILDLMCNLDYIYLNNLLSRLKSKPNFQSNPVYQNALNEMKSYESGEKSKFCKTTKENILKHYNNFEEESFLWLLDENPLVLDLIDDVIDTLRVLRCADAFRQRGTKLRTSGGYPIVVNTFSGNSIFALSNDNGQMFLLEDETPYAIGEANIASTELTENGDLIVSFYTGSFDTEEIVHHTAKYIAQIIDDFRLDIIDSFIMPESYRLKNQIKKTTPIKIILENVSDHWHFSKFIADELTARDPKLSSIIEYATPLHIMPENERVRYLNSQVIQWSDERKQALIDELEKTGYKVDKINLKKSFAHIRTSLLQIGETLFAAGSPPGFIYISLGPGLKGVPCGDYEPFHITPFSLLGHLSFISGTERNASIVCHEAVEILMIPQDIYIKFWHSTYKQDELQKKLQSIYFPTGGETQQRF